MGRFEEDARFAVAQSVAQRAVAAGAVRIEQVARAGESVGHRGADLVVVAAERRDVGAQRVERTAVEVEDAGEVVRVAHVHRVGQRRNRRPGAVAARAEVFVKGVVGVVGGDEAVDRQPHASGEQPCGEVAEVAARYAHHDRRGYALCAQLRIGVEEIEGLGQEPRHVDRVGRCEPHPSFELRIRKGALDQPLAVVERAFDLQRRDVASQRRELLLLNVAYAPFGVEYHYVDALDAEKPVGHGAARVARRGDEHRDGVFVVAAFDEVGEDACHEARAYVLEGHRRAVEEFERPDAVVDPDNRNVEAERVADDAPQRFGFDLLAEKASATRQAIRWRSRRAIPSKNASGSRSIRSGM